MDGNEIISLPSKDFSPDLSLCAYNRFYENILHWSVSLQTSPRRPFLKDHSSTQQGRDQSIEWHHCLGTQTAKQKLNSIY